MFSSPTSQTGAERGVAARRAKRAAHIWHAIRSGTELTNAICSGRVNESFTTTQDLGFEHDIARPVPKPFLFVVFQGDEPTRGGARCALFGTDVVTIGRGAKREIVRAPMAELQLRLPSATVSKEHARIVRRGDEWFFQDLDSRNGSCVNGQRVTNAPIRDGDWIEVGGVVLRYRAQLLTLPECSSDLDLVPDGRDIRGHASLLPSVEAGFRALARVARSPITTLLSGETGTGKEVLARAIHALSGRTGPFVPMNCGAMASSLLESHLFGHVKGAFTGAVRDEPGLIRAADGGTLFLDEVGDLPLAAQAALLRVLQEREILPVGATRPMNVDVRVVAATNKPLEARCLQGEFRADLLARLKGYQHNLPPLRERAEDLGILISDLLRRSNAPNAQRIRMHVHVVRKLVVHAWPQNIRELDNLLSLALTLADRDVIELSHVPDLVTKTGGTPLPDNEPLSNPDELRLQIIQLLEQHRGNVTLVARALKKSRMQLHRWMQKFGIDPEAYRGSST